MSWGKHKSLSDEETRNLATQRHEERLAWAARTYPDLPPLLVIQSLPRLRQQYGRNGVTHEIIRATVESKL